MKVGDLVKLSSYGIARGYNARLTTEDATQLGLIVKVRINGSYPYKVRWSKLKPSSMDVGHMRRELKYAYKNGQMR